MDTSETPIGDVFTDTTENLQGKTSRHSVQDEHGALDARGEERDPTKRSPEDRSAQAESKPLSSDD
jgi:hypothetical protein